MRLRSIGAAIIATLFMAESASALSCVQQDLINTLEDAKASEKLYHILVGKFVTRGPRPKSRSYSGFMSPEDQSRPKPPLITRTYFEGYSLAQHPRQDEHLSRFPVDIETSCAGPWCSNVPQSDRALIAFVEAREGQAPLLKISPCPYWTFGAKAERVEKVRQCLDKSCQPDTPDW